jgi:hypothetical protein
MIKVVAGDRVRICADFAKRIGLKSRPTGTFVAWEKWPLTPVYCRVKWDDQSARLDVDTDSEHVADVIAKGGHLANGKILKRV